MLTGKEIVRLLDNIEKLADAQTRLAVAAEATLKIQLEMAERNRERATPGNTVMHFGSINVYEDVKEEDADVRPPSGSRGMR